MVSIGFDKMLVVVKLIDIESVKYLQDEDLRRFDVKVSEKRFDQF